MVCGVIGMLIIEKLCVNIGIGQGRVTDNLRGTSLDDAVFVSDKESVEMVST